MMRSQDDIEDKIDRFGNAVWRACILFFKEGPDAEDAFQETFYAYASSAKSFNDDEHVKAWLIRVATNTCKDMLKAASRRTVELSETIECSLAAPEDAASQPDSLYGEVLEAMRALKDPPKTPLYLALHEGYSAPEIARMLDAPLNTVYSWIARGKEQMRKALS